MIRTLFATTALATLIATGVHAQTATTPAPATQNEAPAVPVMHAEGSLATNIIGESVYNGTGAAAGSWTAGVCAGAAVVALCA